MRPQTRPGLTPTVGLQWLLLASACLYAVFVARSSFLILGERQFTLVDDAMISMRYAQHLVAGHGAVWNVGEPPVQGFTSPGWMLFMALLHLLPISASSIALGVMTASGICLLLNAVTVHRICVDMNPDAEYAPLLAAAVTAFYFPLVFWPLRGMEVGLLVLLVNLAVLQSLRLRRDGGASWVTLGLILAAALLVRMDSLAQVAIIAGYAASSRHFHKSQSVVLFLLVGATLGAIMLFQRMYFGDPLPNTYYLKLIGGPIWERVQNGLLSFRQYAARDVLMLCLLSAAGAWFYRALRSRESVLLAGLFVIQCLYSIWVGGDYAEPELASANRFIAQGLPALIILFGLAADQLLSRILRMRSQRGFAALISVVVAAATLGVISGTPWLRWAHHNAPLLRADIRRVKAGLAIAEHTSPASTIAVHAAGQIPYYSERRTLDLLGVNDPVIAKGLRASSFYPGHDKWNYDYSIARQRPDLIADNWVRLGDYVKAHTGYRQLENGMYIRVDSMLVDEAGLMSAYP